MRVALYSIKNYEQKIFEKIRHGHQLKFMQYGLTQNSLDQAIGCQGISCFVTDELNANNIRQLANYGVKLIALRSAGFDHVDLRVAQEQNMTVVRVPKYSPEAIAEFAVGLIIVLNRKIMTSYVHGLQNNFLLDDLMGFNLYQKTVAVIGTGNIGTAFVKIMHGFGCRILAVDPCPLSESFCRDFNMQYVALSDALAEADIVSLHCPLNQQTKYIINSQTLAIMKKNAMLINTGRGGLCDTRALINALESGQIGYAGLDVYEKEQDLFFKDHRESKITDDLFLKLRSLANVIITPHQAFLTQEAVENIVQTTLDNITAYEQKCVINQVK